MADAEIVPRPASTLILTRDTPAGLEVFMTQRTHKAVFMPGVYVFPGGQWIRKMTAKSCCLFVVTSTSSKPIAC